MADRLWLYADAAIWALNLGLMWTGISRAGERLGWRIGRWQLDRMHQIERLHGLQLHLELLRLGAVHDSPLMVSAAMEAELEYIRPLRECRRLSEGGYDW